MNKKAYVMFYANKERDRFELVYFGKRAVSVFKNEVASFYAAPVRRFANGSPYDTLELVYADLDDADYYALEDFYGDPAEDEADGEWLELMSRRFSGSYGTDKVCYVTDGSKRNLISFALGKNVKGYSDEDMPEESDVSEYEYDFVRSSLFLNDEFKNEVADKYAEFLFKDWK